ncbi:tRNA dihydrouridine synthase [Periweissella beninensis]|uniref:tRNA-dihydrouridine synthase n=1 Tax=Periweissella beninensis TaxID=504936 RepID=A0ABT0VIS9_9LACO|nr:tRNA-dihydrouridine synthase [Periweissella beninensis]MBM7544366.1 tRNA-dihydrouridine synthase [Periweissella beninensis]MCM2437741.1 tRNA-dihydrouridine synthase [Periweissella beninensis]MCT4395949.1 tRNA-dihydrouridine synthase [Periweissella beninensis]
MTQNSLDFWQNVVAKAHDKEGNKRPFFSLAPMEAVTDTVFRRVVAKAAAPDVYYSEFTHARSVTHPQAKFSVQGRLYVDPSETMPVAQLWGDKPTDFIEPVKAVAEMGYQAIDLNMGCPDGTVIKNGGGSDLIRHFDRAKGIIAAAKMSGLPVSVKTRLGFAKVDEMNEWLPFLLKQDIRVLTVHLRSRQEMSRVPAHYEKIDEIVKMRDELAPHTLIQINGDINSVAEGLALVAEHPGVDGVMIGRGVFANPFCFEHEPQEHTLMETFDLLRYQLDLFDEFFEKFGTRKFIALRRFFKIYVRGLKNAHELREKLMTAMTTDEVRAIINEIEATQGRDVLDPRFQTLGN